jgi:hypothetical protein
MTDVTLILGIVSNWNLPILALLAALAFEASVHKVGARQCTGVPGRLKKSLDSPQIRQLLDFLRTVVLWIGSPQAALTATLFNIYQIWGFFEAAKVPDERTQESASLESLRRYVYYVLSCLGQFRLFRGR